VTALVVDASVWVGAADASDPCSASSRNFLAAVAARRLNIELPALVRIELACALARRLRDAEQARDLATAMLRSSLITVRPLDTSLVEAAVAAGTRAFLRSADAVYAALTTRIGGILVTWDDEVVRRAGAITPQGWLEENG